MSHLEDAQRSYFEAGGKELYQDPDHPTTNPLHYWREAAKLWRGHCKSISIKAKELLEVHKKAIVARELEKAQPKAMHFPPGSGLEFKVSIHREGFCLLEIMQQGEPLFELHFHDPHVPRDMGAELLEAAGRMSE